MSALGACRSDWSIEVSPSDPVSSLVKKTDQKNKNRRDTEDETDFPRRKANTCPLSLRENRPEDSVKAWSTQVKLCKDLGAGMVWE